MIEEIPYSWKATDIRTKSDGASRTGAMVEYTPEDTDTYSVIEVFVPVPFEKARDKDHALEILGKKVKARSPQAKWRKEAAVDDSGDTDTIADEVREAHGLEKKQTRS